MSARRKLAVVGYGKMGRLIEQLAPQHDFEVVLRLDSKRNANGAGISREALANVDAAIEFTTPDAAPLNLKRLADARIPTVAGTTGWLDHLGAVTRAVRENGTGLVWSPNFSIGVAMFRRLASVAAELMSRQNDYDAWVWEIHHNAKKDAPSGTLHELLRTMEQSGYAKKIDISSNRAGKHPGTHEIGFDSAADTITLRHVARSRDGFAQGALKAAQWILDRKGVYTFDEVLFGKDERY
ncbi:MAG: 4-hydroxy-tetrahydrodipicolinate reductase [Bryobacteraceae bacterium]